MGKNIPQARNLAKQMLQYKVGIVKVSFKMLKQGGVHFLYLLQNFLKGSWLIL
jgi:hypothetical protein